MASYRIEVSATAEKQLKKLEHGDRIRVIRAIQALADDPRHRGMPEAPRLRRHLSHSDR